MPEPLPPVLFRRRTSEPGKLISADDELAKFDEFLRSVPRDYPGLPSLLRRRRDLVAAAYGGVPELDLHLEGDSVSGHATDAASLARFIGAASRAVQEVTKSLRGLRRLAPRLQVIPGPGSVRLTFLPHVSVPPPGSLTEQSLLTTEATGLRRLANLMVVAQTTEDVTGAEMLAAVQDLAPTARRAISTFARAALDGQYDVQGTWIDPGQGSTPLRLNQLAARRLSDAASLATEEVTKTSFDGTIDGWEWSSSTIKFRPVIGPRIRAYVPERLAGEAARLGAQRDLPVTVVFTVVTKYGAGSDRPTGRGYTVESIRPAQVADSPPF